MNVQLCIQSLVTLGQFCLGQVRVIVWNCECRQTDRRTDIMLSVSLLVCYYCLAMHIVHNQACIQPTSQINPHSVFMQVNNGLPLHERRPPFTHARIGTHSHLSRVRQFGIRHLAQECKHDDMSRARTHNLWIKSQAPYPLGHRAP
jgi:hypothetical protein